MEERLQRPPQPMRHPHPGSSAQPAATSEPVQHSAPQILLATRRRVLGYLVCYPLLRAIDLAAALNRTVQTNPHRVLDASNMSRHLRFLTAAGLVEAVKQAQLEAALWRLTPRGVAVVAQLVGAEPGELASRWQTDRASTRWRIPQLARLVMVQRVTLGLCMHAPDGFAALDRGSRPGVSWHWMRAWQHRFAWRHQTLTAHADAVILWQRTPGRCSGPVSLSGAAAHIRWYSAFVLIEHVHETRASIRRRVERLIQYRESACRLPVYGEFPPVLLVLRHPHARERWHLIITEVAGRERITPLAGAMATLPAGKVGLADPWRWTWESLADGTRIPLADVLVPLRREAWPAGLADHLYAAFLLMQRLLTAPAPIAPVAISSSASSNARTRPSSQHRTALGPRHERILLLLAQHPCLSLVELAALLGLKESSTARYLRDLHHADFVQRSAMREGTPAGNTEPRWWLTSNGVKYAAVTDGSATLLSAAHRLRKNKPNAATPSPTVTPQTPAHPSTFEPFPRHPEHLWGIYGFMADLHQAAPAHQVRVCWWETGEACERSYPWHQARRNLRPDAEFELAHSVARGMRHLRFWLEYDRGTMHRHDLEAKMGAYADYLRSREWMKDGMAALPRLLFVVPDTEQERRVAEACASCLNGYTLRVLVTTAGHLAAASPYDLIWRQVYPHTSHQDAQTRTTLWM